MRSVFAPVRSILRNGPAPFVHQCKASRRQIHSTTKAAGVSTSAILYAAVTASSGKQMEPEDARELKHHQQDGRGFRNPWPSFREMGTADILWSAFIKRRLNGTMNVPDTKPPNTVPVRKPSFLPSRTASKLRATWLGHACYYLEFPSGLRVLFDPVFTPRCSPVSFFGPKRYTAIPCEIEDIPIIDAVVISHNHYDHLSYPTIMKIKQKHPNAHFFTPLGVKKWFSSCGIHNVTEMDWWKSSEMSLSADDTTAPKTVRSSDGNTQESQTPSTAEIKATFSCLPSQHTTARTPFDKNQTLWSSWALESGGQKVWFAGDTGYRAVPPSIPEGEDDYDPKYADLPTCPAFKQIGDLRGPFDLGLIPIGAYLPRFVMSPVHANPFDSVNIFIETKCKKALGMHWGTFVLTEEDVLEPAQLLKKAMAGKGLPETGVFDVCEIGESLEFGDSEATN